MPAGWYEPKDDADSPKRLFIYGPPKCVKTPLAFAYGAWLRERNPNAKTVYIAADRNSEDLPSLQDASWKEWIKVWKPGSPLDPKYDPYKEMVTLGMTDWKKIDPDIELVIWDTLSEDCGRVLQYCADQEFFSSSKTGDKHITFGDPTLPKGDLRRMNIPIPGDFNGINNIALRTVDALCAQPIHVLLLCWEEDIKDDKGIKRVGPAFVGKALTAKLPGKLTGVIYNEKTGLVDPATGKLVQTLFVCSDPADDVHIAGVRHKPINGDPKNPLAKVKVGNDLVAYWRLFHNTLFPTNTAAPVAAATTEAK